MKIAARALAALVVSLATLFASVGTSHAGLDNELNVVDGKGRTLTIQQWDTFLNGVFPLDRNRLTREWFHSGRANYQVAGPGADKFAGHVGAGVSDRFPVVAGCGHQLQLHHAELQPGPDGCHPVPMASLITTPPLLPGASITADLGNGPGIQEVATFSVDVAGPSGGVAVSNAHGTVTGAAGGVLLRPFARLISKNGDSVTTYGEPWNMN